MPLVLAIDQGTSSSRGIVFDMAAGRIAGVGQQAFDLILPQAGWVEQDPETLWRTTLEAARAAIAAAGVAIAAAIAATGVAIATATRCWRFTGNQRAYQQKG